MGKRRALLAAGTALLLPGLVGRAAAAIAPDILRVSGLVDPALGPGGVGYELASLEALGTADAVTRTPWTQEARRFTGVPLLRLLGAVGARGTTLWATALNDYSVSIPVADAERYGVLLATRLDGEPMRVRDRGPIWVIYPGVPAGPRGQLLSERWIWQLHRIEVR